MPKELTPYVANAIGIMITNKPGNSPYSIVSQKAFTEEVQSVSEVADKIDDIQTDIEKVNENAEYIRRNTENIDQLRETIESVKNIKADVQIVEENTARIESNLAAIETNTANIANLNETIFSVQSNITALENSVSTLSSKDDELDLEIQSNHALIESYAKSGGEIDQRITERLDDYISTESYNTDQNTRSAEYATLYQTKSAAAEDKAEFVGKFDSLNSSVSEICDDIESINTTLITKANQSSVDENAESISLINSKIDGFDERILENVAEISSNASNIQTNTTKLNTVINDISDIKTSLNQKSNQSYVDEQISNTLERISGYVSDGGIVDQKISGALNGYVTSADYISDQESKESAYDAKYAGSSEFSDLKSAVVLNTTKINENTASISLNSSTISSIQEDIEDLKSIKADVAAVNENAQYIRQNAENLETLQTTVDRIQSIKADVDIVQENAQRIASNLSAIESNSSNISSLQSNVSNIQTSVSKNIEDIASLTGQVSSISESIENHSAAIENSNRKISGIEGNITSLQSNIENHSSQISAVSEMAAGNATNISNLTTNIASNTENISLTQDRVSTLENAGFLTKDSFSQGLYRLQGDNTTTSAKHTIVTKKNGKNLTAMIWNESSGGGSQFKNENADKVSFIGVNNGDGDNEIWVQGYAKKISNNTGTRFTLSTDGMYYTKNQSNGSYTANDEVVVKKDIANFASTSDLSDFATETYVNDKIDEIDIPDTSNFITIDDVNVAIESSGHVSPNQLSGLVSVNGVNVSSASHTIVTKKNGKNLTAKLWNESSGGGAQFKNENVGKISFIGVNNGDGDNEIWVQGYAKNISTNVGTRITLSTDGFYYTKNQSNGSYTANDEVVVKKDIANFASTSDLAELATESYVAEKIDAIDIPDTSNFVTIDDVNSAISTSGHISSSQLSGLVAVNGTNVSSAKHTITTKKNGKNRTSMLWNESSGGGSMFTNEDVGKKSFIGVNNGDGDNEIWVQGYAKNIASNIGTRITLTTDGFYYTKNQSNGSYTSDNEVATHEDIETLRSLISNLASRLLAAEEKIASMESSSNAESEPSS